MKKASIIFISVFLCLVFLSACALPYSVLPETEGAYELRELCHFDEIEYVRPDMDRMEATAEELYSALRRPFSAARICRLLDEFYSQYLEFDTMFMLVYIHNSLDLSDEFYAGEYSWFAEEQVQAELLKESVYSACADSLHSFWLEPYYFWDGFREEYGGAEEDGDSELYDRYVELRRQEAEILGEYRTQMASPSISIDGEERDLNEYLAQAAAAERAAAVEIYYEKYNPIFAGMYVELIQLRREQAELLGYPGYAEMAYELNFARDYSVAEAEEFMSHVREHIAPLGPKLLDMAAYYEFEYREMDERELELFLETAAEGLGGGIEDAFEFMRKYGLYDFSLSENKLANSYVTYLSAYEAPYLFLYPYGDAGDLVTLLHEFGHYADACIRQGAYASMDLSESFSQAMQFLALDEMKNVFSPEELEQLYDINFQDMLDTYLQQTALAEFELRAYSMEQPSVEKLNELSRELSVAYGCGVGDDLSAYSWVEVMHLFENPMYVISYPVSAGLALELYELERERDGAGTEKFVQMSELACEGLMEAVEYVGLSDPKSEARIIAVAELIASGLE